MKSLTLLMSSLLVSSAKAWRVASRLATSRASRDFRIKSQLASTTTDDSAFSKSRAPFRMPSDAPDDSVSKLSSDGLAWNKLGLWTEVVDRLDFEAPTPVQSLVVPELLKEPLQSTAFLAATGSGKTLAYLLPLLQQLKNAESFGQVDRRPKRPRLLVLVPTRELVTQITAVAKDLCHAYKLSSASVHGGQEYGKERRQLEKPVDIVVASPGRLFKHWQDQNIFLGSLEYIVLDEMDTMIEQGFAKDLKQVLYPLLYRKKSDEAIDVADLDPDAPKLVMTSATMTQAIQKMIGDRDSLVQARKHHRKEVEAPLVLPPMQVLKAPGLHKAVPRLQQVFVDVGGTDKMSLLVDILSSGGSGAAIAKDRLDEGTLTMVFCNTANACRAAQFALAEAQIETLAYHGELNSAARSENLARFRKAGNDPQSAEPRILVCTDLAARGLDVPQVDHVIMFDFPLNALDYLHRSGRTARGVGGDRTGNGRVTALVSKRDKVLANGIEQAVVKGLPLDGLSSRKTDYQPGGRLNSADGSRRNPTATRRPASRPPSNKASQRPKPRRSSGKR